MRGFALGTASHGVGAARAMQVHPAAGAYAALYERLKTMVLRENGALVSIAHRPGVAEFHRTQWTFTPDASGDARYKLVASPT